MRRHKKKLRLFAVAAFTLLLGGCGILSGNECLFRCGEQRAASTPLVRFLYGDDRPVPQKDATVTLQLPIRVGLAFLPGRTGNPDEGPTPIERERILGSIRSSFADLPYVSEIVPVPSYYFDARRDDGMQQLEQLARLQNLDLVALISYDQRTQVSENRRSFAYLTIVGALVVRGNHNETQTIVDLAVVEPTRGSLVLRAGGVSSTANTVTAIDQPGKLRKQQRVGFDQATDALIANFRTELTDFEARVRAGTADVKVVKQARGGGGAGALDPLWLVLLLACLAVATRARLASTRA
ncbi:MAG TPA: rhombotarget lipoprotein [Steroidobacteraceae bacterium]|jgi:rhombotail lipoprotein|nr:rhombotarget lipoprotein [Steroidobacteraceae bacterium]